jgi:hypothetical protein
MDRTRIGGWATKAVGCMLVFTAALLIVTVGQDLVSGVSTSASKIGPRAVYTLASEPFKYWATVSSHAAVALVLGALAAGAFWVSRFEPPTNEPQSSTRRRKTAAGDRVRPSLKSKR